MFKHSQTSGKVIAAALFGVVLITFAIWKRNSDSTLENSPTVAETSTENLLDSETYTKDSDNDGVRDWEEKLLGTDPQNPDSNNDGISDGEELATARKAFEANSSLETANASTTQTDLIARQIFGAYIQSKQQGSYDAESFDFIIAQATNSQFSERAAAMYTESDILNTSDTSPLRIIQYKGDFQDAITPVTTIGEYELTTYGRAIQTNEPEDFAQLTKAAEVYTSIADTLLSIEVPEDAVRPHLDLINSFSGFAQTLETMGTNPEDPLLTFVATRDFIEGEDAIKTAYSQIDIYFTLKELDS